MAGHDRITAEGRRFFEQIEELKKASREIPKTLANEDFDTILFSMLAFNLSEFNIFTSFRLFVLNTLYTM